MTDESPRPELLVVVDDEPAFLRITSLQLAASGFTNVRCVLDSQEVLPLLDREETAVLLLDLAMPELSGEEILRLVRARHPEVMAIVVTGHPDEEKVLECLRAGAFDYLRKPFEHLRLVGTIRQALEIRDLRRAMSRLGDRHPGQAPENPGHFRELVTADSQMLSIFVYIEAIARTGWTVAVTGETGTGKELIARAVHRASGRTGRFQAVNLAGLDDAMFSDTLFGHVRGAFTGADRQRDGLIEGAAGGTLFLDEIGDLSAQSQVRLLRLLDSGEYYPLGSNAAKRSQARLVVATNRDLEAEVESGAFRRDLYYRLKTHRIHLPPLRERRDLPLLVEHFVSEAAAELGIPAPVIPGELFSLLAGYPFPGNLRELRAMIFDAVSDRGREALNLAPVRAVVTGQRGGPSPQPAAQRFPFPDRLPTIQEMTDLLVQEAMQRSAGNQSAACRLLGISQQALSRRLAKGDGTSPERAREGRKRN